MNEESGDKPRCGLCGKSDRLTRTPCCGNWICDDEHEYVPFSYGRNSCFRNHSVHTVCGFHFSQKHEGRWQDCSQCRENGPLELFVYDATNEYNFEKLENPPAFEPTCCSRCGVRLRLTHDAYVMCSGAFTCAACSEEVNPGQREAAVRALQGPGDEAQPSKTEYPIGTLAYYGPTNRLATKIAASIFRKPGAEPDPLHRWITQSGDIRDDQTIAHQVEAFFRRHRVKGVASLNRIMGCPHEEGKDYPLGGSCPHCPYWHGRDRVTLDSLPDGGMSAAEILTDLSNPAPTRQPIEALACADAQKPELIGPLLRALERGLTDLGELTPGDEMLFSYACYLLAKWREPRAYPLFIRWLSLPGESAFELGGDTITQSGDRLLAGVCDGDLQPIKDLILNRNANEYCRSAAIGALTVLVAWKELPHQTVSDYFLWLAREGLEREPGFTWDALTCSCADIECIDVFPELRLAYDEGLVGENMMGRLELDEIEEGLRGVEFARFCQDHPPIEDVAEETSWWQCFENDSLQRLGRKIGLESAQSAEPKGTLIHSSNQPYRPAPKVGRNELCPCGSGKKYKKCCGK